jgi:hypothetical protein
LIDLWQKRETITRTVAEEEDDYRHHEDDTDDAATASTPSGCTGT